MKSDKVITYMEVTKNLKDWKEMTKKVRVEHGGILPSYWGFLRRQFFGK